MGSFAERLAEPLHAARTTQYPSMSTDTHLINRDVWHTASTGNDFFCEGALPLLASTTCASVSMCTPMPPGNNPVALDGMFCSEEGMMGDSLVYSQLPPSPTSSNITQWSLGVSILIAIVVTNWLPHVLGSTYATRRTRRMQFSGATFTTSGPSCRICWRWRDQNLSAFCSKKTNWWKRPEAPYSAALRLRRQI
ncbi:hypothetical protein FB451DRAFT_431644 [Mycena latifolia]|nr:hypothetical protein FB451DRAFT_431644 [Mycena latifolia]